jgi:hypothetical protein
MISIHWHKRAVAQLYQVEDYILRDFGEKVRKEFMKQGTQETSKKDTITVVFFSL